MQKLDISDILSSAWHKFKAHAGFLVLLTLSFMIVSLILDNVDGGREEGLPLVHAVSLLVSLFSMFTFVRVGLAIERGETPTVKSVFDFSWKSFGAYILAGFLVTIGNIAGLVLLVIPGIIAIIRFGLFGFALVDENLGPIDSIKRSVALTKGHFWQLLGLAVILGLLNFVGALLFGLGLLVAAPFALLATVAVYEKLKSWTSLAPAPAAAPAERAPAAK